MQVAIANSLARLNPIVIRIALPISILYLLIPNGKLKNYFGRKIVRIGTHRNQIESNQMYNPQLM